MTSRDDGERAGEGVPSAARAAKVAGCLRQVLLNSVLLAAFLGGLVFMVLIPARPLVSQGMYVDENALTLGGHARTALPEIEDLLAAEDMFYFWCVMGMYGVGGVA